MQSLRSLIIVCTLLSLTTICNGQQRLEEFKQRLSTADSTYRSRVYVIEHGDVSKILRSLKAPSADERIRINRVCIFSDNSQNAGALANATLAQFKELYPNIPAYLVYNTPYFKIYVGNCLTSEEAITLWGKVKLNFNKAFVSNDIATISILSE